MKAEPLIYKILCGLGFLLLPQLCTLTEVGVRGFELPSSGQYSRPGTSTPRNIVRPTRLPRAAESGNENKILVILAAYTDQTFFYDSSYFDNMLSQAAYSHDGATGSAKEYLEKQFGESFTIDVFGPVKVSQKRHYYGVNNSAGNDTYPGTFVAEACTLADSLCNVNFADYDCNKDGFVDNLFVFYAGEDESQQPLKDSKRTNTDYMWSHSSSLKLGDYGKYLEVDGVKVDYYGCTSEIYLRYNSSGESASHMAPVGTFLHELMHTFGLVDMYDTDYEKSGGTAAALWRTTCLMDAGNGNNNGNTPPNLNSIERDLLGIRKIHPIGIRKYCLFPVGEGDSCCLKIPNPNDSLEYYVLECRRASDSSWDKYIGGSGLLLYHIDRNATHMSASDTYGNISAAQRWNLYNQVNARPDYQCADLVEADSRVDKDASSSSYADIESIFFPQSTATAIGGSSGTQLSFRDSTASSIHIYDIAAASDGTVSFSVRDSASPVPPEPEAPPEDSDMIYIVIQDDGTLLELSVSNSYDATVEWYFEGNAIEDPTAFAPGASGTIKAKVNWSDGSSDILYAPYIKK